MSRLIATGLILVFVFTPIGPATAATLDLSLPEMGDPADRVMSPSEEQRIGERMMREVRREADLVDDPAVIAYLHDLGTRLAGYSELPANAFRFFLINNERLNAFAMPGGYIGVHSGLVLAARRESELASVLAHEMVHVSQRHLARRVLAAKQTSVRTVALILAGILLSTQAPEAGSAAAMSGMASGAQSQLAYSRDHEREADNLGLRLLSEAGFDPMGMPAFFTRLLEASRYSAEPPPFLSTHPLTEARIADSRSRAETFTGSGEVFESPGFALMRARLAALTAPTGEAAVRRLTGWIEDENAGAAARYGLAVALTRQGRLDDAREALERVRANDEARAAYYAAAAELALAADRADQAVATVKEGLSLFPDDYALQYRYVEALTAAGDHQAAVHAVERATETHPWSAPLLHLQARTDDAAGDQAGAAIAMGRFYAARGDLRGALRQLDQVLDGAVADGYQRSRAQALRERWRAELEAQRDAESN